MGALIDAAANAPWWFWVFVAPELIAMVGGLVIALVAAIGSGIPWLFGARD